MAGLNNRGSRLVILGWVDSLSLRVFSPGAVYGFNDVPRAYRNHRGRRVTLAVDIYGGHGVAVESLGHYRSEGAE